MSKCILQRQLPHVDQSKSLNLELALRSYVL
jgi:hypothetical protein